MHTEQRAHGTPDPTADELERERIRRRLEEFERSPEPPSPEIDETRTGAIGALLRFGGGFRLTSVPRTACRPTAPGFEAV